MGDPVSPRRRNPSVPRGLEFLCLTCLEMAPLRRFASAGALADDLARCLDDRPIDARPVPRAETGWRCRRRPGVTALFAALRLTIAAAFLTSLVLWRKAAAEYGLGRTALTEILNLGENRLGEDVAVTRDPPDGISRAPSEAPGPARKGRRSHAVRGLTSHRNTSGMSGRRDLRSCPFAAVSGANS